MAATRRGTTLIIAGLFAVALSGIPLWSTAQEPPRVDFLQAGVDAARTAHLTIPGPDFPDRAFTVQLTGSAAPFAPVLVLNGAAYVLTQDTGEGTDLATRGLWRIGLDTAETVMIAELPAAPNPLDFPSMASDGGLIYIARAGGVDAHDSATGGIVWSWEADLGDSLSRGAWVCNPPAIDDRVLYLACNEAASETNPLTGEQLTAVTAFVAAIDLETRTEKWLRVRDPAWRFQEPNSPGTLPDPCVPSEALITCPASGEVLFGLSVLAGHVLVTSSATLPADAVLPGTDTGESVIAQGSLSALDAATGGVAWTVPADLPADPGLDSPVDQLISIMVTGAHGTVYAKMPEFAVLELETGRRLWGEELGSQDTRATAMGGGLATDGVQVFVTSEQTLHRVDIATETATASRDRLASDEFFKMADPILAGNTLFVKSMELEPTILGFARLTSISNNLNAYDVSRPEMPRLWKVELAGADNFNPSPLAFAVTDGIVVAAGADGNVLVLGTTAASIQVSPEVSSLYPSPSEEVRVDLAGSLPGVAGAPTAFRADWGDGTVTDWQGSPVFTHNYTAAGDRSARFQAGNEAGQTASALVTFRVGGSPPQELNLLQRAFAPGNVDTTLGALGLLLVLLGALFGAARLRRRRSRLQRELEAIQTDYDENRAQPARCEAALDERRHHLTRLLKAGKLDEAQVALLERRIDDLVRNLRFSTIDEGLEFLPLGLVKELRGVLEDGRVSGIEREHVLRLLEADKLLTRAQKTKVRKLVESWFETDTQGRPGA